LTHFNEKFSNQEDLFKNLTSEKCDKNVVDNKINEVNKQITEKDLLFENYKTDVGNKIDSIIKRQKKLEELIETKAERTSLADLFDQIKLKVSKDELINLEDKVFPLMREVVMKTTLFSEKIEDTTSQMIRYDEMILNCASNVDIRDLKNKINACLKIEKFEANKADQSVINEKLTTFKTLADEQFLNFDTMLSVNTENIDKLTNELDSVKDKQNDVITHDDLNELKERIEIKADKLDIIKIYDLKANKLDISAVTRIIDELHRQIQLLSNNNLSVIKNLMLESKNKETEDVKAKNRTIMLKHANGINSFICDFNIGDTQMKNYNKNENDKLNSFKELNDQNIQDVTKLLINIKDSNLLVGNKGFSKKNKSLNLINADG